MNAPTPNTPSPLWCCIHWPLIALDAWQLSTQPNPTAVSQQIGRKTYLAAVNAEATTRGLYANMPLALAKALCPTLVHKPLNSARIKRHLQHQHQHLYAFTPHIHTLRAHDVAIELSGSLKLFKGSQALYQQLLHCLNEQGYDYQLAFAGSAGAAQVLARTQPDNGPFYQPSHLHPLPLQALLMNTDVFSKAGFKTIGDILALPIISRTIRLSQDDQTYLHDLVQTPRQWFTPHEPIVYTHAFEPEIESIEPIRHWLAEHLPRLSQTLRDQQKSLQHLELTFNHRHNMKTTHTVSLTQPTCDQQIIQRVTHSYLDTLTLHEPLESVKLTVYDAYPLVPLHSDLFDTQPSGTCQHIDELLDLLRTRLGHDHVKSLYTRDDFRPENTLQTGHHSTYSATHLPKPTWLIHPPKPLTATNGIPYWKGPLKLLHGPERIQSGWWDQQSIMRDYYIAQHPLGSWVWIYHNHQDQHWYLHGYFA